MSTLGGGSSTLGDCAFCSATLGYFALVLLGSRIAYLLRCFYFCSRAFRFATVSKNSATFSNASISSLSPVKFPFIAWVNIFAAATTLSSVVILGFVKYLCLKNTVSVTLYTLVFLIHTVKHLWCLIDVPKFHLLHECGSHVVLLSDFLCACTSHPNDASGSFIKLWVPCRCALTDTFGMVLDWRSKFNVNSACVSNLHHKCIGKLVETPTKIATKWSFDF